MKGAVRRGERADGRRRRCGCGPDALVSADLVPPERERQEYVAAIGGNDVLKRLTADDTPLAREQSAASGESERRFGHGH